MNTTLDIILNGLLTRYNERVPGVNAIINAMIREDVINDPSEIENDHIAFRTMGVAHLGIQSLEKIFLHCGYRKMDHYFFPAKKLDAYWYAPPSPLYPRIFISELRISDLAEKTQQIIHSYTDAITSDPVDALDLNDGAAVDLFLHRGLWRLPSLTDYLALAEESEYAAWVIYNRYYLNHFTISVHNLEDGYNTIADFNEFLERNGFKLNDAGGKIKTSADGMLLQSSTVAEMVDAEFAAGIKHRISGSYVEFAERKVLEKYANIPSVALTRRHRREGFEASNADRIFESTYSSQTGKQ